MVWLTSCVIGIKRFRKICCTISALISTCTWTLWKASNLTTSRKNKEATLQSYLVPHELLVSIISLWGRLFEGKHKTDVKNRNELITAVQQQPLSTTPPFCCFLITFSLISHSLPKWAAPCQSKAWDGQTVAQLGANAERDGWWASLQMEICHGRLIPSTVSGLLRF